METNTGFKPLSQLSDRQTFPPRPPFIGKIQSISFETRSFTRKTGESAGTEFEVVEMVVKIEPMNIAVGTSDGLISVRVRQSDKKTSVYGLWLKELNRALAESMGLPTFNLEDPKEAYGVPLIFGEVGPTDDMWKSGFGPITKGDNGTHYQYGPRDNVTVPRGAAPAGWEAAVPKDLQEQRETKKAEWESKRAASSSSGLSSDSFSGTTSSTPSGTDVASFDYEPYKEKLLAWLDGRSTKDVALAAIHDDEFRTSVPREIVRGLGNEEVQGWLIANKALTIDSSTDTYRKI